MNLTRRKARVVRAAVDDWEAGGMLVPEQADRLRDTITVVWLDWRRLASIAMRISVVCLIIAVGAVVADEALLALLEQLLNMSAFVKFGFFTFVAAGFFWWGIARRKSSPMKRYTNEIILFLGVLATAVAIACLGQALSKGSDNFTPLLFLAATVYAILGVLIPSSLVWVFALASLGAWFGAVTGYVSGWGAYYLGMNYPLRFVLLGGVLTGLGYLFIRLPVLCELERASRVMGFLYLFIALWIMSIFGNYGDMDVWSDASPFELLHWGLLFAAAAVGAIFIGLRCDDAIARGFGLTFLFINLYTKFFEHFWNGMHKAVFFAILAASFWALAAKAEAIWSLGGRVRRDVTPDAPEPEEPVAPSIHDLEL